MPVFKTLIDYMIEIQSVFIMMFKCCGPLLKKTGNFGITKSGNISCYIRDDWEGKAKIHLQLVNGLSKCVRIQRTCAKWTGNIISRSLFAFVLDIYVEGGAQLT